MAERDVRGALAFIAVYELEDERAAVGVIQSFKSIAKKALEEDLVEEWKDRPLKEDFAIRAAFPTRSGEHEAYGEAMRLVGACHSKGRLLALVNWLLVLLKKRVEIEKEEAKFLLSAIWNYDGFGPPRDEVRKKLMALLTPEELERVKKVYAPPSRGKNDG